MGNPSRDPNGKQDLIVVEDLVKYFPIRGGLFRRVIASVKAVDGVSFTVREGETLGLVGESGCGKTTVGRTLLRLIEPTRGSALFAGRNIFDLSEPELKVLRRDIQIIFQNPHSSFDPRMPIGKSVAEGPDALEIGDSDERQEVVVEMLRRVGLDDYHAKQYPHEFSGGQLQRIGIARALSVRPKFIVADEPVSALDVSIQSQVLNLLKDLQKEFDLSLLFIAHDMSVVEHISTRVAVMYLGKIVEIAARGELFGNPLHPYTQALMSAIPVADTRIHTERIILPGDVPSALDPPGGCRFHPRCPDAMEHCAHQVPEFKENSPNHWVACWLYE